MKKICLAQELLSLRSHQYCVVDGWCIFLHDSVVYGHKLSTGTGLNSIDVFESLDYGKELIYTKSPLNIQELELLRSLLHKCEMINPEPCNCKKIKRCSQLAATPSRLSMSEMVIVINQDQPGNKYICSERVVLAGEYFTPQNDQILQNGSLYKWGDHYWCYWKKLFYKPRPHRTRSISESFWVAGCLRKFCKKSIFLLRPDLIEHLWRSRT